MQDLTQEALTLLDSLVAACEEMDEDGEYPPFYDDALEFLTKIGWRG